jgi:hypothetical protein
MTYEPFLENFWAMSFPIPDAPPVIRTFLSVNIFISLAKKRRESFPPLVIISKN